MKQKMPQLIPFYFINQITFVFISMIIVIYLLSKYILPNIVCLFIARLAINKL